MEDKRDLEIRKLKREVRRLQKSEETLRIANEQVVHTQEFIRKNLEKQVFYTEQLLRTSPFIILLTDSQMDLLMASESVYQYSGKKLDPRLKPGISLRELAVNLLSEEHCENFLKQCEKVLAGGKSQSHMVDIEYEGKKTYWKTSISRMEYNGDVGLNIIIVDTTDVVNALEQAKEADKAKSNFLANMSHEIRTPMNAISGLSEFIIRDSNDEEARRNAQMIRSASRSLLSIINDILDFSKIESGKMEIINEPFQTASMFNDILVMMKVRLHEKPVELRWDIDKNLPCMLAADEGRIKQILVNLLGNAIKFTKKGYVELKCHAEKKDEKHCILHVEIIDTGIGIQDDDKEKIFTDFTRVDTKKNRSEEGTGLGLAISKKLIELMGGEISVESEYGKGSKFSFTAVLRVADWNPMGELQDKPADAAEDAYRPSIVAKDASILVVDDNEMNLEVTAGILEPYGMSVVCAKSGEEAIDKFATNKFDLILMDHMMPIMDGVETMQKIREMPGGKDAVIIVLTANAISGAGEEYRKMGFQEFLSKPIYPKNMDRIMRAYLPPEKIQVTKQGTS